MCVYRDAAVSQSIFLSEREPAGLRVWTGILVWTCGPLEKVGHGRKQEDAWNCGLTQLCGAA